jgi:hypothetical protein
MKGQYLDVVWRSVTHLSSTPSDAPPHCASADDLDVSLLKAPRALAAGSYGLQRSQTLVNRRCTLWHHSVSALLRLLHLRLCAAVISCRVHHTKRSPLGLRMMFWFLFCSAPSFPARCSWCTLCVPPADKHSLTLRQFPGSCDTHLPFLQRIALLVSAVPNRRSCASVNCVLLDCRRCPLRTPSWAR